MVKIIPEEDQNSKNMTKCSNCGEEIDGPAYSLDSDPDTNLCEHCHRVIKNGA